jgi:methionine-gamma-lyase
VLNLTKTCAKAKANKVLLTVDNTLLTLVFQQSTNFGVDSVVQSITKSINAHDDVVIGIVCGSVATINKIKMTTQKGIGATINPHDTWLI